METEEKINLEEITIEEFLKCSQTVVLALLKYNEIRKTNSELAAAIVLSALPLRFCLNNYNWQLKEEIEENNNIEKKEK